MLKLGIDENDEEVDIKYDMQGVPFYSDKLDQKPTDSKMAVSVKSEMSEFDKLIASCKLQLERKTSLMQL